MRALGLTPALAALVMAGTAAAQTPSGDVTTYPSSHYTAFAPQTALDMVRRTPGFVLDEGDEEVRGFGGSSGNVLIDGARPSSKAGVLDALSRIPASLVERIELIRNASTAEAQGQTIVLNVVRRTGQTSGTWSAELERNGNGVVYPRLEASASREIGGWRTSIKARAYWEEFPFRSLRLNRDADGGLTRSTVTDLPSTLGEATLSGDASRPIAGGLLNVTGRLGHYNYYFDQPGETFLGRLPDGAPDQTQLNQLDIQRWTLEVGADWTRVYGDWSLKTLGLVNYRDGAESSRERRQTPDGMLVSRTVVESTAEPLELVGRATLTGVGASRLRPEFGGEVAYNKFDRTFDLAIDDGGGLAPVPIPASNVTVEEFRGEAFANLSWTVSPRWTLEGGLAVEASEISVTGDADQSQSFNFVKPSLAVAWRPTDRLQFRLGARRTVGQLDFNDFAATADLDDDTTAAGNPDLGPDQTTRYYASLDYRGGGDLAVNIEVFHEDRQDVLEQIVLPSGAPGLANAGDATYRGVKGTLTLPLDRILAGARLTAEGEVLDSTFDDPVIGRERPLSFVYSPDIELEFRHDPPGRPFSWGVSWQSVEEGDLYLVDEIDGLRTDDYFGGFIETTALGRFKTRLAVRNADTQRSRRFRTFFEPDRAGVAVGSEERFTRNPAFVTLTFSGNF